MDEKTGIAVPIVVIVMLLLSFVFLTTSFLTRNQRLNARFYYETEAAISLAESALEELEATFETVNFPRSNRSLADFYSAVLSKPSNEVNGLSFPIQPGSWTTKIQNALMNQPIALKPVSVSIKTYLSQFQPLASPLTSVGIFPDPIEKEGLIKIEVKATCGITTKALNAVHRLKVVNITHPVFSRFSLFVKHAPTSGNWVAKLNSLHQSVQALKTNKDAFYSSDGKQLTPIVMSNGEDINLAPGKNINFASIASPAKKLAESNAPIFLGGKWRAGLCEGTEGSQYSEKFLVRMARYDVSYLIEEISRAALKGGYLKFAPSNNIQKLYLQTFGMNDDCEMNGAIVKIAKSQAFQFFSHPNDNTPMKELTGSFVFRLFGTMNKFSPTIVLGDVERFFQKMMTVDCVFTGNKYRGVTLPHLGTSEFYKLKNTGSLPFDYATNNTLKGVAWIFNLRENNELDLLFLRNFYKNSFMSTIQSDHFIRALDFVFTNRETGNTDFPISQNNGTSPMPEEGEALKTISPKGIEFDEAGGNYYQKYIGNSVTLKNYASEKIFSGDLNDIDGVNELLVKSVVKCESGEEFKRRFVVKPAKGFGNRDLVKIVGIVFIKGKNDFVIDSPWDVRKGGVIVTQGNIVIKAPIYCKTGEPLTLCSGDSIFLANSGPIRASLLCTRGVFRKDPNLPGFSIVGSLAAGALDFDNYNINLGNGEKTISYDSTVDSRISPPPSEPFFPRRFFLSREKRVFFGKGK